MAIELKERGVPFQRQVQVTVSYKGQRIRAGRLDLLIDDRLILGARRRSFRAICLSGSMSVSLTSGG